MPDAAERKAREEELVRGFARSDVWKWLQQHLEAQRDKIGELAADPRWTPEQRALLCGQLGVVLGILRAPSQVLKVADAARKSLERTQPPGRPAPRVVPGGVAD